GFNQIFSYYIFTSCRIYQPKRFSKFLDKISINHLIRKWCPRYVQRKYVCALLQFFERDLLGIFIFSTTLNVVKNNLINIKSFEFLGKRFSHIPVTDNSHRFTFELKTSVSFALPLS